jgi:pentatricopeptide repeat protein
MDYGSSENAEWIPGTPSGYLRYYQLIEGRPYPLKSYFLPQIEALLNLGDIDEASYVYDQMLSRKFDVQLAAGIAKSLGMEDLARLWGSGAQINKNLNRSPYFYIFAERGDRADFGKFYYQFSMLRGQISPNSMSTRTVWSDDNELGWRMEDGERWALLSPDGRILAQDSVVPDKGTMQAILKRNNIIASTDAMRAYLAENGSALGAGLWLAYQIIQENNPSIG